MKPGKTIAISAILALLAPTFASAAVPAPAASAHGFDVARIESDTTLAIPTGMAQDVWNFIQDRFVNDQAHLQSYDPKLTSVTSDEQFVDTYFDTNSLPLLDSGSGLRHRRRHNESNPDDIKSGRELVQLKSGTVYGDVASRTELKFPVRLPGKTATPDDMQPLIGLVKKNEQENLKKRLTELHLDPYAFRPILTLTQRRQRITTMINGKPFVDFSVDTVHSKRLWFDVTYEQMELELNEITYTEADAATKAHLKDVRDRMVTEIADHFPQIVLDPQTKYKKAFDLLEKRIPWYRFWIRWGLL